ncbi:MAG: SDR family oxidoreductase [Ferruginibacter sp.]|nr:SDR family oxidoreductase [Ferruginibacter sp.]
MYAVITGASKGIGKAIANIFASHGCNLILCSKGELDLYKAVADLQIRFPSVIVKAKPFDLSKDAKAFGDWVLENKISPTILINNAGYFEPGNVYNEPEGLLEKQIETNLYSAYHLTRKLLPTMMANATKNNPKHIFNICSVASLQAYPNGGAYSISKFAMAGFSKNLRQEMLPHHIKVTTVYPGAVFTNSWKGFDNTDNRIMEADDVAKIIFAASQLSVSACVEELILRPQQGDL